ncbi:MAG: hypothetical protein WCK53_15790, partial [Methanomicrobiales archaeon]
IMKDPAQVDKVEKDYQLLNNAIRQLEDQQKRIEQNIREQAEKGEREIQSPTIKAEIATIIKCIRQHNIPHAQELFQNLARQQLAQVNTALSSLQTDGAVIAVSSDPISQQIAAQHYGDAVIDSEKAIAELTRVRELYVKAKILVPNVTGPPIIQLFEDGKYEEFILAGEEQQRFNKKVTELKEKGRKLLVDAEKFGQVPDHVRSQLDAQDIPTIERAITELEAFRTTLKPELILTLGHTQLIADEYARLTIQLANRGNAHVRDIRLAFSDEFDTKWIRTMTVNAGVTTTLDIGIRPKLKGNIPLEVTALYFDGNDKEYRETHEFWIDVVEKGIPTFQPSEIPPTHVDKFTPKTIPPLQTQISRAYEFYAGYIRVKIAIKNSTPFTIHDVILEPDIDKAILYLERHEPEQYPSENEKIILGTINPHNDRTVSLYLEPIICAKEGTDVHCHVRYKDAQGQPGSVDMEPLRIQVVCPIFETKEPVNIGSVKLLIESLPSRETKVFSVPGNIESHTLLIIFQSVIQLHDIRHIRTLRRANNFESWYYGRTKVSQRDMVIKLGVAKDMDMVEITAFSHDPKDLTGLLAEISRHVTEEFSKRGNVQK